MSLSNYSFTDDEYRSLEANYDRRVTEAERIMAMLEEISEAVGPVWSPAIVLKGIAQVHQKFPSSFFYDQQGCAGIVFVSAVFEHRPLAMRFQAVADRIKVIYAKHTAERGGESDDPAFSCSPPGQQLVGPAPNDQPQLAERFCGCADGKIPGAPSGRRRSKDARAQR